MVTALLIWRQRRHHGYLPGKRDLAWRTDASISGAYPAAHQRGADVPGAQPVTPTPDQVKRVRETVQANKDLGITAAQDLCAVTLHTSRHAFQQWETGARAMHPAFWELLTIKTALTVPKLKKSYRHPNPPSEKLL